MNWRPLILAAAAAAAPGLSAAQQPAAVVGSVRGDVTIGPPGEAGAPAQEGDPLPAGQVLTTGADGGAILEVSDGGRAEIGPAAAFAFYEYGPGGRRYLAALARGQFVFEPPFAERPDLICSVLPPDGPGVPFEADNVRITMQPGEKPYAVACVRGTPPAGFVQADARFGRPAGLEPPPLSPEIADALGVRPLNAAGGAPIARGPLAPPSPDLVAPDLIATGDADEFAVTIAPDAFGSPPPLVENPPLEPLADNRVVDQLTRNRAVLGVAEADNAMVAALGPDAPPLAPPPVGGDPLADETERLRARIAELESFVDDAAAPALGAAPASIGDAPPLILGDGVDADLGPDPEGLFDSLAADGPPLRPAPFNASRGPSDFVIGRAQSAFAPGGIAPPPLADDSAAPGDRPPLITPGSAAPAAPPVQGPGVSIGRASAGFPAPPRAVGAEPLAGPGPTTAQLVVRPARADFPAPTARPRTIADSAAQTGSSFLSWPASIKASRIGRAVSYMSPPPLKPRPTTRCSATESNRSVIFWSA
ncbi:MAG: hypothetical protein AAF684_02205, partial [Pseudomonadota bacterium]